MIMRVILGLVLIGGLVFGWQGKMLSASVGGETKLPDYLATFQTYREAYNSFLVAKETNQAGQTYASQTTLMEKTKLMLDWRARVWADYFTELGTKIRQSRGIPTDIKVEIVDRCQRQVEQIELWQQKMAVITNKDELLAWSRYFEQDKELMEALGFWAVWWQRWGLMNEANLYAKELRVKLEEASLIQIRNETEREKKTLGLAEIKALNEAVDHELDILVSTLKDNQNLTQADDDQIVETLTLVYGKLSKMLTVCREMARGIEL